jgi:hypothetical protein
VIDAAQELMAEVTRDLATLGPPLPHPSKERPFNAGKDDNDEEDRPDFPR